MADVPAIINRELPRCVMLFRIRCLAEGYVIGAHLMTSLADTKEGHQGVIFLPVAPNTKEDGCRIPDT